MRLRQKYKLFKQLKQWKMFKYIPQKLLLTKKKLWKTLLANYSDKKLKLLHLKAQNKLNTSVKIKRWEFNRKSYKQGLDQKRYYYHMFDSAIKNKLLKNYYFKLSQKYNNSLFINNVIYLLQPVYRIDILLWLLRFTNSIYEARNIVFNKRILLNNNHKLHPSRSLVTGDIIQVKSFNKDLVFDKLSKKQKELQMSLNLFCEIDYYTKSIVIVKDVKDVITSYDNPQIFFNKINIKRLISHLKREY